LRPTRGLTARAALWFRAAFLVSLPVSAASAREPVIPRAELPGIGSVDPRRPVDSASMPWSALGRVQTELGGRCTGTLIAPRTVLTAAHCLVSPRSGGWVRPASVHFLLGYRQGAWTGMARAVSFVSGPGFDAGSRSPASADWALLTLDVAPGHGAPLPLLRDIPAAGTPVLLGGYQQDRPEVLMADTGCQVLGLWRRERTTLLVHGCAGTRGASGAPLLVGQRGGGWAVAGVAVAVTRGQAQGVAVPAAVLRQMLEE